MQSARAFMETLRQWDVRYFFGLPGSTEAALLDEFTRHRDMRFILGLHESVLVAMADGYARASGRPGVVGLHTSVGSANGWSMVYNAHRDGVPMVVTAGHKETGVLARDGFCAVPDLAGLFRDCTKWTWQSLRPEQVAEDMHRCLHVATTPVCGPTFLSLPEDMMDQPSPEPRFGPTATVGVSQAPDGLAVERAAALLAAARLPVLLVGAGVAQDRASQEALRLAEQLGMAVVWQDRTSFSRADVPSDHPQFMGGYGDERVLLEQADVVLAVGARLFLEFSAVRAPRLPAGASLIHIHRAATQVGWLHSPTVAMVADARSALQALLTATAAVAADPASAERRARVLALAEERRQRIEAEAVREANRDPMSVALVARALRAAMPDNAVLVDEAIRSATLLRRHFPVRAGGELLSTSGGSLGWGLPAAMGVKLAQPDRPVVAVVGDGSLHFSVQALWTAVRQELPVVVVVLNNQRYLAVKRAIEAHVGSPQPDVSHPGTELTAIDHCMVARGYGAGAALVTRDDEVEPAIRAALASGRPYLVECRVAPTEG